MEDAPAIKCGWNGETSDEIGRETERERPRVAAKHIAAKCAWFFDLHIFRIEDRMSWSDMVCEIEDYSVSHLSSFWKRSMRADHHRHALGSSTLKRSYHSSLLCSRISVAPQFTVVSFVCLRKSNWRRPCREYKAQPLSYLNYVVNYGGTLAQIRSRWIGVYTVYR